MHTIMKTAVLVCCAVAALLALAPRPIFAHHGAAAYDISKSITLDGTVTSLDWNNPHCLLHFDAKNDKGEMLHWTIELYNPLWLMRVGWKRKIVRSSCRVSITFQVTESGGTKGYIRVGDGQLTLHST